MITFVNSGWARAGDTCSALAIPKLCSQNLSHHRQSVQCLSIFFFLIANHFPFTNQDIALSYSFLPPMLSTYLDGLQSQQINMHNNLLQESRCCYNLMILLNTFKARAITSRAKMSQLMEAFNLILIERAFLRERSVFGKHQTQMMIMNDDDDKLSWRWLGFQKNQSFNLLIIITTLLYVTCFSITET